MSRCADEIGELDFSGKLCQYGGIVLEWKRGRNLVPYGNGMRLKYASAGPIIVGTDRIKRNNKRDTECG